MTAALHVQQLARRLRHCAPEDRLGRACLERRLVQLYQDEPACRAEVLAVFRPFAASFAVRLKRGEEPLDDLRQVALVGLVKALERFDPAVGRSFTAFAAPTILGELRRHYRDTGWAAHVPRAKQELAQRLMRAARELERSGSDPTDFALADRLGVPTGEIVEGRLAAGAMRATSSQRPVDADDAGGHTLEDLQGTADPGYAAAEHRVTLGALTRDLSERDRTIVALRFARELPQAEIGQQVGVSQMQVSRILRRVIAQLGVAATRAN
jgi:RNA polymerase sigma-B factor